jgi:predicted NAD/FAD-binding protein
VATITIGSRENNIAFLAYLTRGGHLDIITAGCTLCRTNGHPFTVACNV